MRYFPLALGHFSLVTTVAIMLGHYHVTAVFHTLCRRNVFLAAINTQGTDRCTYSKSGIYQSPALLSSMLKATAAAVLT